ncbi:MAG: hypothetical protein AB1428_15460 [Bacteroidota bacterium]
MKRFLFAARLAAPSLVALLPLLLICSPSRAEEPSGEVIGVEVHGSEVTITYNLRGEPDEEYEVRVFLISRKRPDVSRELQLVSGHVGTGKFAGKVRRILWNMKEFADIQEGEPFVFRIVVDTAGTPWYYWVGGGALAGGIATYLIVKGKPAGTSMTPVVVPNPLPPAR